MLRPGSWTNPAGVSPVRVDAGVPGSTPRFVTRERRAPLTTNGVRDSG